MWTKYAYIVIAVMSLLAGCSGKQNAIIKAHNKMVAAEHAYLAAADVAVTNDNFQGLFFANKKYLHDIQNIDRSGCPDDYKQALKGLENSLSEISGYLSGANNIENIAPTKFDALHDARMDVTHNLNSVAERHGTEIAY